MTTSSKILVSNKAPLALGKPAVVDITKYVRTKPWEGAYAVFNMIVYGPPGEGKTPFVASVSEVPELMPALYVDIDSGTLSVRDIEELDTIHISQMAAEMGIDEWACLERIYAWVKFGDHNYKTVILDGGTDLERYCELACIQYGIEYKKSSEHDPELAELSDYRRIQERMKRMYMRFRDVVTKDGRRINLIATAHEGKGKDELTGAVFTEPLFLGKGSVKIVSVFDIIARLVNLQGPDKKVTKYLVPCLEGKARGRDRSKSLGERIENPTMKKITERIFPKEKASNA